MFRWITLIGCALALSTAVAEKVPVSSEVCTIECKACRDGGGYGYDVSIPLCCSGAV